MQLQVLKAIERILGPRLPIQHFFDLIVGTGYVQSPPRGTTVIDLADPFIVLVASSPLA